MAKNDALTVYATKEDVKNLDERARETLPGGKKLTLLEAVGLAQIALAHGLDPWNGEVWYIPGSGVMVGIKGLRKSARAEAAKNDSTYWIEFRRVDPNKYNEPETSIVWECDLRDTHSIMAYSRSVHSLVEADIPWVDIKSMLGQAPVVIGVGIAKPEEKSKMAIHARARKRAEADAIKQRYGVEFTGATITTDDPEIIDGEFKDPEEWHPNGNGPPEPEPDQDRPANYSPGSTGPPKSSQQELEI